MAKFSPHEVETIPRAAISFDPLGCIFCSFETKVQSNLIRHFQQHMSGQPDEEEFVNPVPDKKEMNNFASSSHQNKTGLENSKGERPVECPYKNVPNEDRYNSHIKEYGYLTRVGTMLWDHISIIHNDERHYVCPHCIKKLEPLPIPIHQLSKHLKLHESPVYECVFCEFYSHLKRSIERHTEVVHPGEQVDLGVVRLFKPEQTVEQPKPAPKFHPPDTSDEQGQDYFCCNLCLFKTEKIILQYGITDHKMSKPVKCLFCGHEGKNEQISIAHCGTFHSDKESQVISLYKKDTEIKKLALPPIHPLWKRDPKQDKLIRGIELDEKEDVPPSLATATTGIDGLDSFLELKFGHLGTPLGSSFMCPRCSNLFVTKSPQEMREHLYKDLGYAPVICKICKISSALLREIRKHVIEAHNVKWDGISESIDINANKELESWVDKVLTRQVSLMNEASTLEGSQKRCRSSETSADPAPLSGSASLHDRGLSKERRDRCPSSNYRYYRFSCEYCNISMKNEQSIIIHFKNIHPDMPPKVKTLETQWTKM